MLIHVLYTEGDSQRFAAQTLPPRVFSGGWMVRAFSGTACSHFMSCLEAEDRQWEQWDSRPAWWIAFCLGEPLLQRLIQKRCREDTSDPIFSVYVHFFFLPLFWFNHLKPESLHSWTYLWSLIWPSGQCDSSSCAREPPVLLVGMSDLAPECFWEVPIFSHSLKDFLHFVSLFCNFLPEPQETLQC